MDELLARVPKNRHDRFREIVALTDSYCAAHLNDEFRDLCRTCAADACATQVPVTSGKVAGWAAGVVYEVAFVNFLTGDPSQQFHTPPDEIAKRIGVSPATMHNKAKAIRTALDIVRTDPRYSTRRMNDKNPLNWILSVNGFLMDIRQAPREAQVEAFRKGLIPYIPADGPPAGPVEWPLATLPPAPMPRRGRKNTKKRAKPSGPPRVYALDVTLLSGPITREFAKKNKRISRTIEIRGDQTLEDLHWAIYDAFDRDDPHMYEFQFGKKPMDEGRRYIMPEAAEDIDDFSPPVLGITDETTIDEVELKIGQRFFYWFDFGDDWHHRIDVVSITEGESKGAFPRVTKRVGDSPPQYLDWDAEG